MATPEIEPLGPTILAINYFGDVIFAVSGALTAARYRMDLIGVALIGIITGIGGGTIRDVLLGRTVWWTQDPTELVICLVAALLTFFFLRGDVAQRHGMVWSDALGLAAFCVVGCHVALSMDTPVVVAVLMGMLTATGGGIIRDILTRTQPMILCGELYATAALAGALAYAGLHALDADTALASLGAFAVALGLRAAAIVFGIKMGPPGDLISIAQR
ncbi:MAG: TRIC cation channel family protein [Pseudomonadota bacterium]